MKAARWNRTSRVDWRHDSSEFRWDDDSDDLWSVAVDVEGFKTDDQTRAGTFLVGCENRLNTHQQGVGTFPSPALQEIC